MLSFQLVLSSYVFLAIAALGVLISCFTDIRLLGPFIQNCDDINPLNCSCMIVLIRGLLMKLSWNSHHSYIADPVMMQNLPSVYAPGAFPVLRRLTSCNCSTGASGFWGASLYKIRASPAWFFLWFTKRGNLKSLSNVNFWPLQSELSSILDSSYSFVTCTYQQGAT